MILRRARARHGRHLRFDIMLICIVRLSFLALFQTGKIVALEFIGIRARAIDRLSIAHKYLYNER